MSSRDPSQHSYVPYTNKPYIYYNGVPIQTEFHCTQNPAHPYRTILQTNDNVVDVRAILSRPDVNSYSLYKKNCNLAANNFYM